MSFSFPAGLRSIDLSPTGVLTALATEVSVSAQLQAAATPLRTYTELAGICGTGNKGSL
jgi:hypothetical protein